MNLNLKRERLVPIVLRIYHVFLLYFYLILQNMYVVPGMRFVPDFCGQSTVVCDVLYLSTFRVLKVPDDNSQREVIDGMHPERQHPIEGKPWPADATLETEI
jgi:hypothetical protein